MVTTIASDIHGSADALELLLLRAEQEKTEHLILLGDLLTVGKYNPRPEGYAEEKVLALLNQYSGAMTVLRGNGDEAKDDHKFDFPLLEQALVSFNSQYSLYCHHGHEKISDYQVEHIYVQGHSHVPEITFREGTWTLNPGSIALPRNGHTATYLTLENNKASLKQLSDASTIRYQHLD